MQRGKNSHAKNWVREGEQWGASLLCLLLFVLNLLPPFVVAEICCLSQSSVMSGCSQSCEGNCELLLSAGSPMFALHLSQVPAFGV